jgi:hypothetical protein
MWMKMRRLLLIGIFLAVLSALTPERARAQACTLLIWGETRTRSFIFTYQESAPLGREIANRFGDALDAEFNRFANLFETSLPVPIMVRIYPNERAYYCFNALAVEIPIGQTHSHIGGREIALIAQNITADPEAWEFEGMEALHHELAILFLNALTAEKAPPGLLIGLGIYAEDPFITFEDRLVENPPPPDGPSATWRSLWESPNIVFARENVLQAASITAYLIDVYGWERFLEFAGALRTSDSWRPALEEVYPTDANALENHWESVYYPVYFEGRWRENVFFALSLAPYEQLIAAGAYQAAADGLAEVIAVLVDLEDFEKLNQAQKLNALAQQGLQADAEAELARTAYLEGDFPAAGALAAAAMVKYAALGDERNAAALAAIRDRAGEIETLHAELDEIREAAGEVTAGRYGPRVIEIEARLTALGDTTGAADAAAMLDRINAANALLAAGFALAGVLLAGVLLARRLIRVRAVPPPEARLQT